MVGIYQYLCDANTLGELKLFWIVSALSANKTSGMSEIRGQNILRNMVRISSQSPACQSESWIAPRTIKAAAMCDAET